MSAYTDKELAPIEWLLDDLLNTIDDSTAEELHDSYPKLEALVGALKTRQSEWHPTALKQELKQSLEAQMPKFIQYTGDEIMGVKIAMSESQAKGWAFHKPEEINAFNDAIRQSLEALEIVFQDKGDNRE